MLVLVLVLVLVVLVLVLVQVLVLVLVLVVVLVLVLVHHHQVLGDLELIDQGELDHKIIAIDASDPMASKINSIADLKVIPITDPSLDLLLTT